MSMKRLELDMPLDVISAHVGLKFTQESSIKRGENKEDGRLNSRELEHYISEIYGGTNE